MQDGGLSLRWAVISCCFFGCSEAGLPQRFQREKGRCSREGKEGSVHLHTQQAVLEFATWQNETGTWPHTKRRREYQVPHNTEGTWLPRREGAVQYLLQLNLTRLALLLQQGIQQIHS